MPITALTLIRRRNLNLQLTEYGVVSGYVFASTLNLRRVRLNRRLFNHFTDQLDTQRHQHGATKRRRGGGCGGLGNTSC